MSLRATDRQAFLACSCPNNGGNPRQFTGYCRQVIQNVGLHSYQYHNSWYLRPLFTLSRGTVILCTQSAVKRQVLQAFRGFAALKSASTKKRGAGSTVLQTHYPLARTSLFLDSGLSGSTAQSSRQVTGLSLLRPHSLCFHAPANSRFTCPAGLTLSSQLLGSFRPH